MDKLSGIEGGLHRTAEFGGDADTDNRNSGLGKRKKCFLIILNGGHGRLGVYALFIYHLLIKITDINLHIFFQVALIIEGYIEGHHSNVFFLCQFRRQVTGTVTYNMKCFCHIKNLSVCNIGVGEIAVEDSTIPF